MRLGSLLCVLIALAACRDHASRGPRAFVSNEADGTVSVIDLGTRAVVATIHVGKRPRAVRVSPDGKRLYVALSGSPRNGPGMNAPREERVDRSADGIGVVDLATLKPIGVLQSGADPESFDIAGDSLVVSNEDSGQASIVDLASGQVRTHVPVGEEPEGVVTASDGLVFVTSEADAQLSVLDPRAGTVVATIPTGARPRGIVFAPDGHGLVTCENDGALTAIDATTHRATGKIQIPEVEGRPPRPMGIALAPDGKTAYVTTGRGGSLALVDVASGAATRVIPGVGQRPWGVAVGRDGLVYTANGPSNDVSVVDPADSTVLARIPVGGSPWGVALEL